MIVALALSFAANLAPTNEAFTVHDVVGPCHIQIEGKPSETPPGPCAAAIAAAGTAKEEAILYFTYAFSLNGAGATLQALPNLDKAIALAPNFRNAVHERSFTLNDLGFYERAVADSDRDIQLSPDSAESYDERAFARERLADFEGSLADRQTAVGLKSTPDRKIAVIRELMWLGRYDEAAKLAGELPESDAAAKIRADIDRRRKFKPDGKEKQRCALAKSVDDRSLAQKMVDDCTWAFDHEVDPAKRADFLTTRSANAIVAFQNRDVNLPDLEIAAALDPRNPQRHVNLGFALMGISHSWAARNEFDKALAARDLHKQDKALALAGRGQARANLGDNAGAFADAKASFEIQPLEASLWLLGDLAFARGDKEAAKTFWMGAYHLGSRDDALVDQLKSVGVEHPEKEPR